MEFDTNLDYVTITHRCGVQHDLAVRRLHSCVFFGAKQRPWHFLGYNGYTIRGSDGHLSWGEGRNGGIIQASGVVANTLCRYRKTWATEGARVTRLDLAVTFNYGAPREIVRRLWTKPSPDWRVILPAPGKGGGTLYVGNRTSDRYGRLYDKGAQLNPELPDDAQICPSTLWRAEVEFKGDAARSAWAEYDSLTNGDAIRHWTADVVINWFQDRGVVLGLMPESKSIITVASRAVDDARSIRWLYEQVRPVLYRLSADGKLSDAMDALGIEYYGQTLKTVKHIGEGCGQFDFFDFFADTSYTGLVQ